MRWLRESNADRTSLPAALLFAVAFVITGLALLDQRAANQALERRLMRVEDEAKAASERAADLEHTVARQHGQLRARDDELAQMRFQLEAVEMQLDGIDVLSRDLRETLDLPPGEGTWSGDAAADEPQGGAYQPADPDLERLTIARRRLAAGLAELAHLRALARARNDQPASAASATSAPAARLTEARPANWPARGAVTSAYGWRTFRGRAGYHHGIDIALPYGSPVMATGYGVVVGSGWQPGYGWSVLVQHGGGYTTLYAHLSEVLTDVGAVVLPGVAVGRSGSSGTSTGPHLHYEVWHDGQPVDPRPYMDRPAAQ